MSDRGKQRARDDLACPAKVPVAQGPPTEQALAGREAAASSLLMSQAPRRIAFAGAALFSAALHAAAFVACLAWSKPPSLGAVELPMDVVSIELAPSPVLEALPQIERQEPAPAMAPVAAVEGKAEADAEPERSREMPEPEEPAPEPPFDPPKLETEPAAAIPQEPPQAIADAEALPARPVAEKEEPQVEQPVKPDRKEEAKREPQQERKSKRETRRTDKGGVTSRARSGTGSARASASAGSILRYAAYVRARVAGNKPSGNGHRGTTAISFGVTRSGGLAYASIRRSSGSAALDRLALGAVRAATPFPPPPPGARPEQLRFSIAFHFR